MAKEVKTSNQGIDERQRSLQTQFDALQRRLNDFAAQVNEVNPQVNNQCTNIKISPIKTAVSSGQYSARSLARNLGRYQRVEE